MALAREEIAGDEGVLTADGFKDTEYMGIPLLKTASSVMFNRLSRVRSAADKSACSLPRTGGPRSIPAPLSPCPAAPVPCRARRELEERYHGLCENMEGAAVAQVAACHGVPWLEVRGISNMVEDRDLSKWDYPGRRSGCAEGGPRYPGRMGRR